jgi:type IV pilus secretin PilQ/predicted competence protein
MKTYGPVFRPSGLILAVALLSPHIASAQEAQPVKAQTASLSVVAGVGVDRAGEQTVVRVQGQGPLDYRVTRMSDPLRVVVDFDNTRLAAVPNTIPSDYDPVRRVRVGQANPDQVRIVIDLASMQQYKVERKDQSLVVAFQPEAHTIADSSASSSVKAVRQEQVRDSNGTVAQTGHQQNFRLPAILSANAGLASPAQDSVNPATVMSGVASSAGQVTVTPAVGNPSRPPAAQPVSAPAPGPAPAPVGPVKGYTGEAISVNLKDVDLKDFFRLIHEISGLNVVLDPAVRGSVTLVLDEVPWDQALDIVLRNNGLSKELDGNVLRIATRDTLKREADDEGALRKAETEAVDPVTVTRVLSYAKASELVIPLKRFLTQRGDVMAIDRSNTLIIRDIPAVMPQVDNLVRQLDRKSQQVAIEARVVQASRTFARDIGTQFGIAGVNTTANTANFFGGNPIATMASPIIHTPAPPIVVGGSTSSGSSGSGSIPLNSNLPANAPTSGFSFSRVSPNFTLDFIITAAESKGVGKLLSSPQLVTQNNAQAIVKQGQQIPIQTTINNTISVQYVDAVLKLQVTPQITADGNVFMDVLVENTQIDSGIPLIQGTPALDTQSAQTKVLVNDGGTVVIGGVMVNQQQTTINQVPLLGNIPLIGHLFKETSVNVQSQELLFFLTPRLIPG